MKNEKSPLLSKPCCECQNVELYTGFKYVFYYSVFPFVPLAAEGVCEEVQGGSTVQAGEAGAGQGRGDGQGGGGSTQVHHLQPRRHQGRCKSRSFDCLAEMIALM